MKTNSSDSNTSLGGTPRIISDMGYRFEKEIGKGAFSRVFRVRDKDDKVLACKRFDLTTPELHKWVEEKLKPEMKLVQGLSKLNHPNICKIYDKPVKTRRQAFIFMEMAENGSIEGYLTKINKPIEENQCKDWFRQIANGIKFLHDHKVAHRDVKPENFLLTDNYKKVLITDFGFAANSMTSEIMRKTLLGTPDYQAPEMLTLPPTQDQIYDAKKVDMWALGVSLYQMLHNSLPYPEMDKIPLKLRLKWMKERKYKTRKSAAQPSVQAVDCYDRLMEFDIKTRLSAEQLVEHPWIK